MSQSNEQSEIGKMQRGCGAWHGHECARTRYRVIGAGGSRRCHVAPPCHVELPRQITYYARATPSTSESGRGASWVGRASSAPARIRCPCVAYWLDGNAHSAAKAPSRRRKTASRGPMRSNTPKCGEGQLLYNQYRCRAARLYKPIIQQFQ